MKAITKKWISLLLIYAIGVSPALTFALPGNGQVVAGSGTIGNSAPGHMVIQQNTSQMITNWQSFSIGSAESVTFNQPNAQSVSLNRVTGQDPSRIMGRLTANGQVFLTNPSGILFGPSAVVNAHGLVATTLGISDQDFLDRNYRFFQDPTRSLASVINQGRIETTGYTGLLAPAVSNTGTIIANLGSIALSSGEAATLDFTGNGLIHFALTEKVSGDVEDTEGNTLKDRVHNSGTLKADGGQVILSAQDAGSVIRNVINNEGVIEAKSVVEKNGRIFLFGGDSGIVSNSGTLDVSGKNSGETGGQVIVLGEKVGLFDEAKIDASGDAGGGEILLGGEQQGATAVEGETNTDILYIDDNAEINADAITEGDGGRIITWATDTNRAFGNIYARGGAVSGNGGFVEISGGKYFEIGQIPDVSAVNGQGGHWLIDPTGNDLQIVAGGGNTNINALNPFATTNDAASLGWNLIRAALIIGAAVTVTTTTSGTNSQSGNITVNTDLDYNGIGTGKTLTLNAIGDIQFNNKIFDSAGTDDILNLVLLSGGGITLDADGSVVSGTLNVTTVDGALGVFDIEASTTFTVKGLGSTANSVITAFDFDFNGTFNFDDTDTLSLIQSASSTSFGLGTSNCGSVCDAFIDNADLNRVVVPNGILDFQGPGNFFIQDVAAANTDQINEVNINVIGGGDINFGAGTGSTFTRLQLGTSGNVNVNSNVTTAGTFSSFLSLNSSNFNVAGGSTINTTNDNLAISTDDIDLQGNLNSGTATTSIIPQGNIDMELGVVGSPGPSLLQLDNAEILRITAGSLELGPSSKTNRDVFIDGVTAASFNNIANFLFINAGRDIVFQNNASTFRFLTATANDRINVQENVSSTVQDLTLNADFNNDSIGDLDIAAGTTLTSNSVLRLNAGSAMIDAAGSLNLSANNSIDLQSNTSIGGNSGFNSDLDNNGTGTFMVGAGKTVDSSAGNFFIFVTAADVALNGNVNTGTNTFTVRASNNRTTGVGTGAGDLTIDGGELSRISAGTLQVGDTGTNTISINNITAAQTANINNVNFNSANQLNVGAGGAVFRSAGLFINDGINIAGNVTATTGALEINADSDADNNGILTIAPGVILDSADFFNLNGQGVGTGIVANGAVTLRAQSNININSNMSANGVLTMNADTAAPGSGTLTIAGNVTSNNNNVLINADDISLPGSLNAGTGNVFVAVSDNQNLNLGTAGAGMSLADAELDTITANKLSFFSQGNINVDNVSNNSVNQFILNTSQNINFVNQDSTVRSIDANANGNINFQNSLTATAGGINLKADVDGNGAGNVNFGAGVTVASSNNNISISANDYVNAPTFTLNAGTGDISINVSDGGSIGVGNASCLGGCGMQISKVELSNIFARDLTIGGFNAGNIFANNITPLNVANINRNVIMNTGKNITFLGGASAFKGLQLNAITDINILTNVATTQFDFTAIADFENNTIGQFNMPSGVTVASAGNINVKAAQINAAGNFIAAGNVNLVETFPITGFNSGTQSTFLTRFLKNAAAGCS